MHGRDKHIDNVTCPACKAVARLGVSEENYPENGEWLFSVDSVPDGFELKQQGDSLANSVIYCTACNVRAV